jgi:FKBP-type peptidyl-prolyl cis-trans isomerase FkpA
MKNTIIIVVLAIISVGSLGYIASNSMNSGIINSGEAKEIAESFINGNLLQGGAVANIGEVSEENGLYKIALTLPDGVELDSYLSKDGQLFFPEGMDIEKIKKEIAESLENNANNQNQMELKKEILTEGSGEQVVKSGDAITVDYTGVLEDGTQFDSSIGRAPFSFTIGQGSVIQGWDQGLIGMKVGEEIKLTIPSDMAYGTAGAGTIPPNATLIFTVKLISID